MILGAFPIVIVVASTGCGTSGGGEAGPTVSGGTPTTSVAAPARPTLTAPHLQPPVQDNKYVRSSSRPKVVVDPCTWVPDSAIQEAGFDPVSRGRGNDMLAEYSFLVCKFKKDSDGSLTLESGNVALDEVRQKYQSDIEELTINGRPAVKSRKDDPAGCSVDLQTNVGYFGITVRTHTAGLVKGMKPCDHIVHIATILEPSIGKEN
ncbi:DUF3558 domain-containing protein [Nocardia lasii]|uniref:DUF3558 domain-containing protein n=1 Tax=Nocardia lasii TaxID=1616107 RepID=A0ABW1JLB1_9NOCA